MILNNEFVTLKAVQHQETLTHVGFTLELSRNNKFYFNREGLQIIIKPRHDTPNDQLLRFVWYTSYKAIDPPENGSTQVINDEDYTVYVGDHFYHQVENIELLSLDGERINRNYSSQATIIVKTASSQWFEMELPLKTIELPEPVINELRIVPVNDSQVEIKWKGTNPGDFYQYRLISSWGFEPEFVGVASVYTYLFNIPAILRGQQVSFTIEAAKDRHIFDSKTVTLLFPRVDFNVFHRMEKGIENTKAIYTKQDGHLISVARVWQKRGGFWYTD